MYVQVWRGSCEGLWALRPFSERGSLRFGTLRASSPVAGVTLQTGRRRPACSGLWPLCRPAFGSRLPKGSGPALPLPSRLGPGPRPCLPSPRTRAGSALPPGTPRGADGLGLAPRSGWLGFPCSAFSDPGSCGRRRVRPGGAVPYFTRCRAGVRRSSDK